MTADIAVITSVPTLVPALVDPGFDGWEHVGVVVGSRVEASTQALEQLSPGLGTRSIRYWDRCRSFWDDISESRPVGPAIKIERELANHRQSTKATDRRDLVDVLDALDSIPVIRDLVDNALSTTPDWDAIRAMGLGASVAIADDVTTISFTYLGRQDWPELLGGLCSRGETSRTFDITVSHAKWRDRRNRRLVAVVVNAGEVWPDPTSV